MVVGGFAVFESLDGLLVVGCMLALSKQVIYRHIEHLGDLESHLDGGAVLLAHMPSADIPGGADCLDETGLDPVIMLAQFDDPGSKVENFILKIEFCNRVV